MAGVGWEGGRSKREGIYVYVQLIHFIVKQELTQHCKATISQFEKKSEWYIHSRGLNNVLCVCVCLSLFPAVTRISKTF